MLSFDEASSHSRTRLLTCVFLLRCHILPGHAGVSGPIRFDKNGDLSVFKGAYEVAKFSSNGQVQYTGAA